MSILRKQYDKIILVVLLLIYLALATNFILLEPVIWPDEAYLADVAGNILTKETAGTSLWGDTIVGIKKSLYWYPPIYTYILSFWFKAFGFSILNQRILSITLGFFVLIISYLFIMRISEGLSANKKKLIGLLLILLLILDSTFLKAAKIGRPEIMVILFGFLSLYFFKLSQKNRVIYCVLSGLFSSLATLTHLAGGFFPLIILIEIFLEKRIRILKDKRVYIFILSFALPASFWLVNMLANFPVFLEQLSLQSSFRTKVPSHIEAIFRIYPLQQKITYFLYLILSTVIFWQLTVRNQFKNLLLIFGLLAGWLICLFGKLEWYTIYIIIFLYVSALLIVFNNNFKKNSLLTILILMVLFTTNVISYFQSDIRYKDKQDAYFLFGQEVKTKIPEGKTVYLSTTPDLYFVLKDRNPLYEFPTVKPIINEYLSLLNDSDYIVISFHLEHLFVGDFLDRYIELNKQNEYSINSSNLYQAQIIELVPKNLRQSQKYD